MLYPFKKLYRPELFQGNRLLGTGTRYFEGWYFKAAFSDTAIAVIPGVSQSPEGRHAFIQVIEAGSRSALLPAGSPRYHSFDLKAFSYDPGAFRIAIGDNRFSLEGVELNLEGLRARLAIRDTARWPSAVFSPSSMGWYSFMRFMECYHGIIVLDAEILGTINGRSLEQGRFYLEKDWGHSFPRAWIWMQTNSFLASASRGVASLTCSVARVPFRGGEFTGFIIGLYIAGRLQSFTTYNGARLGRVAFDDRSVSIEARRRGTRIRIRARRASGAQLASPRQGQMSGRIEETLDSDITVELWQNDHKVFSETGIHAGLEVVNPQPLLAGISPSASR